MRKPYAARLKGSDYIIQHSPKSHCGKCEGSLDLLCTDTDPTTTPWFYICWNCKRISQCGVGPVSMDRILLDSGMIIGTIVKLFGLNEDGIKSIMENPDFIYQHHLQALLEAREKIINEAKKKTQENQTTTPDTRL